MSSQIGALFLLQPQKLDEFDSVLKAAKAALLVLGQPLLAMLYEQRSPSACTGVAVTTRGRGREVLKVRLVACQHRTGLCSLARVQEPVPLLMMPIFLL